MLLQNLNICPDGEAIANWGNVHLQIPAAEDADSQAPRIPPGIHNPRVESVRRNVDVAHDCPPADSYLRILTHGFGQHSTKLDNLIMF